MPTICVDIQDMLSQATGPDAALWHGMLVRDDGATHWHGIPVQHTGAGYLCGTLVRDAVRR